MMTARRTLASLLALTLAAPAALANPGKVLVLQAEGRADGKVRAKVHGAVMKLAKSSGGQISPGDITYAEAAAAVGCKPEATACKDEVIGMLSVDEIVTIAVTPKPGGFEVVVHRVGKGGTTKEAKATVTADKADHLEAIAPLFGGAAAVEPKPAPKPEPKPTKPEPKPEPPKPAPIAEPAPEPAPPPVVETPPQYLVPQQADRPKDRGSLYLGGMAAGGTMFVIGAVLWSKASSIQSDIDTAPVRTRGDLVRLQELEADGDAYAGWGNVLVIGGVIVAGASTYLYFRNRRLLRSSRTATLTPLVFPGGGGVAFTVGGAR